MPERASESDGAANRQESNVNSPGGPLPPDGPNSAAPLNADGKPRRRRRRGGRGRGGRGRGRGPKPLPVPPGQEPAIDPNGDPDLEPDDGVAAAADAEVVAGDASGEGHERGAGGSPSQPISAVPAARAPIFTPGPPLDRSPIAGQPLSEAPTPRSAPPTPAVRPPVAPALGTSGPRPLPRAPLLHGPVPPPRFAGPPGALHQGRLSFGKGKQRHQFRPGNRPNWVAPGPRENPPLSPSLRSPLPPESRTDVAAGTSVETPSITPAPAAPPLVQNAVREPSPSPQVTERKPLDTPLSEDAASLASFAEDIEIEEVHTPARKHEPTGREMLINVVEGEEVRIAIVQKSQLEELYMERSSTESHIGNIYKGRVMNVEPSIQAAFIDFGCGKNGFLHISDLHPQYFPPSFQPSVKPHPHPPRPPVAPRSAPDAPAETPVMAADGAVPEAKPEAEAPISSTAAGSEPFGELYSSEEPADGLEDYDVDDDHMQPMERVGRKTPRRDRPLMQHALRRGQEVLVQVIKEGIGTKGPTLTTYISIPGRYLVMMPGMKQLGVSRKIDNDDQRRELRRILEDLNPPKNLGFIIRTAGLEQSKKELQGDLNYLLRMWKVIASRIRAQKAPSELYQESDLVIRTIRDVFTNQIDRIIVDNEPVASRVRDFLSIVNPRSASLVELYTGQMPLFQKHGVEREIEKIHSRRVEMANGGSLVIDSTEALVAIDVNSGRYRATRDAEMMAFNMNKEAVKEVCRQLRLRDLGGVIVTDFIDMREERHKREIERLLKEYLKADRAKTKVLRMSLFCMVEMTRQRVRPSLKRSIYQDCPHCHGSALIKTPESVTLDVMRRLAAGATRTDIARLEVRVYPTVADFLQNRKRKALVELEDHSGKRINITPDRALAGDAIQIEAYDARNSLVNVLL